MGQDGDVRGEQQHITRLIPSVAVLLVSHGLCSPLAQADAPKCFSPSPSSSVCQRRRCCKCSAAVLWIYQEGATALGWDGGSDELLTATAAPAAPRTAERFAKALHEAGTEVQTRAASSAPGWELPAGSASCSLPPQPPALGWGQMLLQHGGRSIGQSRAEASESRSGSVGESCLRDGAPGARQSQHQPRRAQTGRSRGLRSLL